MASEHLDGSQAPLSGGRRSRGVYRRRRAAVACAAVGLLALVSASAAHAAGGARSGPVVVVAAGATLWGLAMRDAPPTADVRAWIAEVERENHLRGAAIQAGQELRLPAGSG